LEDDFHVPLVPSIGHVEALKHVRAVAKDQTSGAVSIALSDQPVARGALFDAAGARVPFPEGKAYDRCYVALLDPSPTTRWAHPAWWAFVPAGGDAPTVLRGTELPENQSGSVRLLPVAEPSP
jgi:hypothetical protein